MKRGAKGIIGLQRVFKICDDDNSGHLNRTEFFKALREYKLEVTDEQVNLMFNIFDGDRSGSINFDEFLFVIAGQMNEKRKALVEAAFKILDKDNIGLIDVEDIIGTYNAKSHPAVLDGRKTEEDVLEEFLQTFEMHHNNVKGKSNDFKITREEFAAYY
jgi:calcyphosin